MKAVPIRGIYCLGVLTIALLIALTGLAYLMFTLPGPGILATPTVRQARLYLPTAPPPPVTVGPRLPNEIIFTPEEPIKGFSSCDSYGFRGVILDQQGERLEGLQVIAWSEEKELLGLDTTGKQGTYLIEFPGQSPYRNLWLQIYRNDMPVSEPLLMNIQIDCQQGFQVYQVHWRESGH